MNYNYGSFWRKWDLHVHTIESKLNNGFGDDWDKYVHKLFSNAISNEVCVIGITDYFSIEGYKKICEYIEDVKKLKELFSVELKKDNQYIQKIQNILLLPNIEIRLDSMVSIDGVDSKMQMHVIFSNDVSIDDIESLFINRLNIIVDSSSGDELRLTMSKRDIKRLGNKLMQEQPDGYSGMSEYKAGLKGCSINIDNIKKVLSNKLFKNKYLVLGVEEDVTKINWNGQGHMIRKKYYQFCDGIFSSNAKTIKWGTQETTRVEFGSYMPCLWGSDAHSFDKLFNPDKERYCWVKSDTNFEGLLQSFIMPEDRIYIGMVPPVLDNARKRKSMTLKDIQIKRVSKPRNSTKNWFDVDLQLNPFMITIIGNKGSGKSALTDILSYTGDSQNMSDASFLSKNRFLKKDNRYGEDYYSNVNWYNGNISKKTTLSSNIDPGAVELVKFLPQKYIEKTCNDLENEFQSEINKVIFSYVDAADKTQYHSLEQLIADKISKYNIGLMKLRNDVEKLNYSIFDLEDKSKASYKRQIEFKFSAKQKELVDLDKEKPAEIKKPVEFSESKELTYVTQIDDYIQNIEDEISVIEREISLLNSSLIKIEEFNSKKSAVVFDINELNNDFSLLTEMLGIELKSKKIIRYDENSSELNIKFHQLVKDKEDKSKFVNRDNIILGLIEIEKETKFIDIEITEVVKNDISLYDKKERLTQIKDVLLTNIDNKSREYQKYIDDLKEWSNRRKYITGEIPNEDSIAHIKTELEYINVKLPKELEIQYVSRLKHVRDIYKIMTKYKEEYYSLYSPIQMQLSKLLKEIDEKITFDVQIEIENKFTDQILTYVDQRASGFFHGTTEGKKNVDDLLNSTNVNDEEEFINLISTLFIETTNNVDNIDSILNKNRNWFFQYLCELRFLEVNYVLKLNDRLLSELSPGERGIVLLVFYLALDKENIPLIIDQPEDNLDNQSVFGKLVPCIKSAKANRQIIVVTHNPNIAVACDSEQVIYCEMDKTTDTITYIPGSIENSKIKTKVLDILEGTLPAFTLRKDKYEV